MEGSSTGALDEATKEVLSLCNLRQRIICVGLGFLRRGTRFVRYLWSLFLSFGFFASDVRLGQPNPPLAWHGGC